MLCFGGKSCFLMINPKVGNRDQTELNTDWQSVKFQTMGKQDEKGPTQLHQHNLKPKVHSPNPIS